MIKIAIAVLIKATKTPINSSVSGYFRGFAKKWGKTGVITDILASFLGRYIMNESELIIFGYWRCRGVVCWIICVENCTTNGNLAISNFR